MSYGHQHWPAAVREAFEACSLAVTEIEHRRWQLYLGEEMPITARIADDWLLLEGPYADDETLRCSSFWGLLQCNAALSGGAKFALGGREPFLQIRAEIPLIEKVELRGRIRQACVGFGTAWSRVHGQLNGMAGNETDEPNDIAEPAGDLARLCLETGWPCVGHSTGSMKIALETPNEFYQASIEQRSCQIAVHVEIAAGESISPLCRQSLAVFLLASSGHLRMARPTVVVASGCFVARLGVAFDGLPSVPELCHALSALSMGCRLAGREAAALQQDEELAQQYLTLWRVNRGAGETAHRVEKNNQLTKALIGAEKGESVWVPQ